jgi:hypothetical protein
MRYAMIGLFPVCLGKILVPLVVFVRTFAV